MKLRTKLLSFTAAIALSAGMAFAAIDGNALADKYLEEGYTYVEVKVGPTQTKVEAIKGDTKLEVVYDNESGAIIDSETDGVEADDAAKVGKEVKNVSKDFEDGDDEKDGEVDDDEGDDDDSDDDEGDDDDSDDDSNDDSSDDEGDDDDSDESDDDNDSGGDDDDSEGGDDGDDGEGNDD